MESLQRMMTILFVTLLFIGIVNAYEIERNEADFGEFYLATEFLCQWGPSFYIKQGELSKHRTLIHYSTRVFNINYKKETADLEHFLSIVGIKNQYKGASVKRCYSPRGFNISFRAMNIFLHAEKDGNGFHATRTEHISYLQHYRATDKDGKRMLEEDDNLVPHIEGFVGTCFIVHRDNE